MNRSFKRARTPGLQRIVALVTVTIMIAGFLIPMMPASAHVPLAHQLAQVPGDTVDNDPIIPIDLEVAPESTAMTMPMDQVDVDDEILVPLDLSQEDVTPEEEESTTSNISVNLYWCPTGVPVASASDGEALKPQCQINGDDLTVELISGPAMATFQQAYVSGFPSSVAFSGLAPDNWRISITPGAVETNFFCSGYTPFNNTKPYAQVIAYSSGEFPVDTIPAESVVCDWFGISNTPVAAEQTGNLLNGVFRCPSISPDAYDHAWFQTNCTTPIDGMPMTVDLPDPMADLTGTSGDITPGMLDFLNVPVGSHQVSVPHPGPPDIPILTVFCAEQSMDYQHKSQSTSNAIFATITASSNTACNWYFQPSTGAGNVLVNKYDCPTAAPAGADRTWFRTNCLTSPDGVVFTLEGALDDGGDLISATGDSIPGSVRLDGVKPGDHTLTETVPADFTIGGVFCASVPLGYPPLDTDFAPMMLDGSSINTAVYLDGQLTCEWYNVPKSGVTLVLNKWECPSQTDVNGTFEQLRTLCTTRSTGVTFAVADAHATQNVQSASGPVTITGLEPEPTMANGIRVTEQIPPGYQTPAIFCVLFESGRSLELVKDVDYAQPQQLETGDEIHCDFFNRPEPTSVVVHKFDCPQGTDPAATDPAYFATACMTEMADIPFELTDANGITTATTQVGGVTFDNVAPDSSDNVHLREIVPAGYGIPVVFCQGPDSAMPTQYLPDAQARITLNGLPSDSVTDCYWYNLPETPNHVLIYKWECPEGVTPQPTIDWHANNCVKLMDGVEFTLTDAYGSRSQTTSGGLVEWNDVSAGPVQVAETVPAGYSPQVFLVCYFSYPDGTSTDPFTPNTINGVFNFSMEIAGTHIRCDWYNYPVPHSEIVVYKWTCPPGYDYTKMGADPQIDCTNATDGIDFILDQPGANPDLTQRTGDVNPGAVYFGGLTSGTYTLTEQIDPTTLQSVFVWACYGLNTSAVNPTPLSVGTSLTFTVTGGEQVQCHWFNVPKPPHGSIIVTKYNCSTQKWVSDAYCIINSTGQVFELQVWNGTAWVSVGSGTTNVLGQLDFSGLQGGDYRLIEPNATACLIKSNNITSSGNIGVTAGTTTTVHVYNCAVPPPPPTKPGDYPNTGVDPEVAAPSIAGLLGLAGLTFNRRRFLGGAAAGLIGMGATLEPGAAQDAPLMPLDATPSPAMTDTDLEEQCLPADAKNDDLIQPDDDGTPAAESCVRGPVPTHIRIPSINVDAKIEYLDIIDGAMEAPTNATDVAWYKGTGRLGEPGNAIFAGHLNYWGVPEGVFFRLESVPKGTIIEVDGIDQKTYLYEVEWIINFPSDEEPVEHALGPNALPVITLITCGGAWITDRSEYDHRSLVRAVLKTD